MEFAKVILENGVETEVKGLFYIYNSNYYFLYTEKELDENNYVILKLVQVGKEVKNTENGSVETGYMIGVEPTDWDNAKKSITLIVDDKKNQTQNADIRYLPINMLATLKITKHKVVKLVKSIVEQYFGIEIEDAVNKVEEPAVVEEVTEEAPGVEETQTPVEAEVQPEQQVEVQPEPPTEIQSEPAVEIQPEPQIAIPTPAVETPVVSEEQLVQDLDEDSDVIIDYRKSFFEEQEKNKELEAKVQELTEKLNKVREIIE